MKTKLFILGLLLVALAAGCAANKTKKEEALRIMELGEAYLAENKLTLAYREFSKAREMDPDNPHVYFNMGLFFYHRKQYDRAIENFQQALKLKPGFATARNNLGVVYMEKEEWDLAIKTLTPVIEDYLYATPHYTHLLLGQACFNKKDYDRARFHFQESLDLMPEYVFAAHWLGKTWLETGNAAQAAREIEKAVKQMPWIGIFHYDLGRAQAALGQIEQARRSFTQAASLAAEDELLKQDALRQRERLQQKVR